MYKIILWKKVQKFIKSHKDETVIFSLYSTFCILENNPFYNDLDIKKMAWYQWKYRLRLWKYRLIYEVDSKKFAVYCIDINSRWDIYK